MALMKPLIFLALSLSSFSSPSLGVQKPASNQSADEKSIATFNIKESASENDWQHFFASQPKWRFSLWKYQEKLGHNLSSWHWTWRIGWIKSCRNSSDFNLPHCSKIIAQGSDDNALVVRSEVVEVLANLHAGSENTDAVEMLEKIYKDKRNSRAGKPLYIQKQIIYAIKAIGGSRATSAAANLAKSHPDVALYYDKLKSAQ